MLQFSNKNVNSAVNFCSNSDFKKTYGAGHRLIAKSAGVDGLVSMKEISFHAQGCTAALGVTFVSRKNRGPPPGLSFIHIF
jgi:hypothetical protein